MIRDRNRSRSARLERSCNAPPRDWQNSRDTGSGVQLLMAWFSGHGFDKHRHDTYVIGLTETGVQAFDYRGAAEVCIPGEVFVLHPDVTHDGRAGDAAGFGYRTIYVEPARISEAVRAICGRPHALPFVREPVSTNRALGRAVTAAFQDELEPLAIDSLVLRLAEGLLEADTSQRHAAPRRRFDVAAIEQARQFLDEANDRVVRTAELEAVSGLTRYDLARQFRALLGTSPYRYSLMRRLDRARESIDRNQPLADVALAAGFADQAHLTRQFKAAYGITPARYGALKGTPVPEPA